MIKLKNIIQQLKEGEYVMLCDQMKENKADKFLFLLNSYRENGLSDEDIMEKLDVNTNAYYTLKSRLYDKIQDFLMVTISGSQADLMLSVSNIPNLIFNTPSETANAVLTKLEKDLLQYDLPYELTMVYSALKKIHLHSSKYFEYSQLYNKHLAYTISIDKAEELLANFHKTLGEYFASRNPDLIEILLVLKREMSSLSNLYDSHHLRIYKYIVDISFGLFAKGSTLDNHDEDLSIEDMLGSMENIFKTYSNDLTYKYFEKVYNFLSFEYYLKLKLHKNALIYFEALNNSLVSFMRYNFCCFTSKFLLSKLEYYSSSGKLDLLANENNSFISDYNGDKNDVPNYLNYVKYLSASAFYNKKYLDAINYLNTTLNEISLRNYTHSEIEIKLFLALVYSMINKYDNASVLIKSVSRKFKDVDNGIDYENAFVFSKMIKLQLASKNKSKDNFIKLMGLREKFSILNQGSCRMLEYVYLTDELLRNMSMSVKSIPEYL